MAEPIDVEDDAAELHVEQKDAPDRHGRFRNRPMIDLLDDASARPRIHALAAHRQVQDVHINLSCLGMDTVSALFRALGGNLTIARLTLMFTDYPRVGVSDHNLATLGGMLGASDKLRELTLTKLGITDAGVMTLSKGFMRNRSLIAVDLSHNRIGDPGAALIAEASCAFSLWDRLDMSHNRRIGDHGAISFARTLESSKLRELSLGGTSISDGGMHILAQALQQATRLQLLDLSNLRRRCYFGPYAFTDSAGIRSIARALQNNQTGSLVDLDLSGTVLDKKALLLLAEALHTNTSLQMLHLGKQDQCGGDVAIAFKHALTTNRTLMHFDLDGGESWDGALRRAFAGFLHTVRRCELRLPHILRVKGGITYQWHPTECTWHEVFHSWEVVNYHPPVRLFRPFEQK